MAFLDNEGLSALAGIRPTRRADWARRDLLRRRARYGALDAIEVCVLKRLIDVAGPKRGMRAWATIRAPLREVLAQSRRRVWAVIDGKLEQDALAGTTRELAAAVGLERPVYVIPLAETIREARQLFTRLAADEPRQPRERTLRSISSR